MQFATAVAIAACVCACASTPTPRLDQVRDDLRLFDGATGVPLSLDAVVERAAGYDVVIVGERHDSAAHHLLQAALVNALGGPGVVVGLEMVSREQQPKLDAFKDGAVDIDTLPDALHWNVNWGFSYALYRPIFEAGQRNGSWFLALNVPREVVRAVRKGEEASLPPQQRNMVPPLRLDDEAHRAWFRALMAQAQHPGGKDGVAMDVDGMYRAQVLWDEVMAQGIVGAHRAGAKRVIALCGAGHIARGRGIPLRIHQRNPALRVLTVVPVDVDGADDVVAAVAAARDAHEGDVLVVVTPAASIDL